jgi:hypothetical protein
MGSLTDIFDFFFGPIQGIIEAIYVGIGDLIDSDALGSGK